MEDFVKVVFCTSQTLFKEYLIHNQIVSSVLLGYPGKTAFDMGEEGLLMFTKDVSPEYLIQYCCEEEDTPVVLRLYLPGDVPVTVCSGEKKELPLRDVSEGSVFLIKETIFFQNVYEVLPVGKNLTFLLGDSTLYIPKELIHAERYEPVDCLAPQEILQGISAFTGKTKQEDVPIDLELDESDESAFEPDAIKKITETEDTVSEQYHVKDRALAAMALLLQDMHPGKRRLNANIFHVVNNNDAESLSDYVSKYIYPGIAVDIDPYVDKEDPAFLQYYCALKGYVKNEPADGRNLFRAAFEALAALPLTAGKEDFKRELFSRLTDDSVCRQLDSCMADNRARAKTEQLKKENNLFLPLYFLYTFYDYSFDRIRSNLSEFSLGNTVYAGLILSLWAFRNGMAGVFEEYKLPEFLYVCSKKIETFMQLKMLVSVDVFQKVYGIVVHKDEIMVGNYRCSYINYSIEYESLAAERNKKIRDILKKLKPLLEQSFDFEYQSLKRALNIIPEQTDFSKYTEKIHKRFVQEQRQTEKTKRGMKKTEQKQQLMMPFMEETNKND